MSVGPEQLRRTDELFAGAMERIARRTDHLFAALLSVQWLAAIALAFFVSPRTWVGDRSEIHVHVWAAIGLGFLLTAPGVLLAWKRPGTQFTRHVIAASQVMYSALLIHLTGGRIETHFHVFGSLAFLSFYRDGRVILSASLVVAADHVLRGLFWPESVFGVLTASIWRPLEHAGWVLFEDVFLLLACQHGRADVRAASRRQAALEVMNRDVEKVVEERTRELAEARDAALEAARVKAEFLANMSHEIRTPLNGVLGFVDLLAETELLDEQKNYVRTIRGSGETLLAVINDILDFSKIEAGRLELERIEFDLGELVESVGDLLGRQASGKGVEFLCSTAAVAGRRFQGDPTRLRQVLLNLCGNAVKFTERGEVLLRAEAVEQVGGVQRVRLMVKDTGIGIPPERQRELFTPFTQVDGSTTRRFGGTGLGLAITLRLVRLMGGTIELASEPGHGTTVVVELDLQAGAADDKPGCVDIAGRRVLVVDDNATNRALVREILEACGCRVTTVDGGEHAIERAVEAQALGVPFHLGILDYQMPGMDGLELAAALRKRLGENAFALVLASSMGMVGKEAFAAGIEACLSKPLKRKALLHVVRTALHGSACASDTCRGAPAPVRTACLAMPEPTRRDGAPETTSLEAAARPRSALQEHEVPLELRPCRVLLAEDNPVNQRLVQAILKKDGHEVLVAADGQSAVDLFRAGRFDVVLMDMQMPVMDGYEAMRAIRQLEGERPGGRRVPMLALTARAMKGDREGCLEAGADDYVAKPIDARVLREKVATASLSAPAPAASV